MVKQYAKATHRWTGPASSERQEHPRFSLTATTEALEQKSQMNLNGRLGESSKEDCSINVKFAPDNQELLLDQRLAKVSDEIAATRQEPESVEGATVPELSVAEIIEVVDELVKELKSQGILSNSNATALRRKLRS